MTHRFLPLLILFAACTVVHESDDPAKPARLADLLESSSIIDLTHPFDAETIYWPTADGFKLTVDARGYTEGGYYYAANSFCAAEHGGTHLDAPLHFAEGGWSADRIPVERLIGPAVRIDVSSFCLKDADYEVTIGDFQSWESRNGSLPEGVIVLLYTGFGRHWPHRGQYLGTEARGEEAVASLHFPGLGPEAARWLVENRSIRAIGLDTASIDFGQSKQSFSPIRFSTRPTSRPLRMWPIWSGFQRKTSSSWPCQSRLAVVVEGHCALWRWYRDHEIALAALAPVQVPRSKFHVPSSPRNSPSIVSGSPWRFSQSSRGTLPGV